MHPITFNFWISPWYSPSLCVVTDINAFHHNSMCASFHGVPPSGLEIKFFFQGALMPFREPPKVVVYWNQCIFGLPAGSRRQNQGSRGLQAPLNFKPCPSSPGQPPLPLWIWNFITAPLISYCRPIFHGFIIHRLHKDPQQCDKNNSISMTITGDICGSRGPYCVLTKLMPTFFFRRNSITLAHYPASHLLSARPITLLNQSKNSRPLLL